MSHTSGNILLHLIFSTEHRRPLIKPSFQNELFAYLGGIIREMRGTAIIVNGMSDHVHMLVRIRPSQSAAEIVRTVKSNSSRWLRENGQRNFAWQTGVRRIQRKRIQCSIGHEIHRQPTRASQNNFVQRGIHRIPEKEQNLLRRKISVGLTFFRPSGA